MTALQIWLENHNRRLTQVAIDEALMEYITQVEKQRDSFKDAAEYHRSRADEAEMQRDELLAACKSVVAWDEECGFRFTYAVHSKIHAAIASVKEK